LPPIRSRSNSAGPSQTGLAPCSDSTPDERTHPCLSVQIKQESRPPTRATPVCDRCGTNDRAPGSKLCPSCENENKNETETKVICSKCGGEDFREFGSTNYSQALTLKRDGEKIVLDDDDECGGYGDRIDYPDGDEAEGVECVSCQQTIEVEGVSPVPITASRYLVVGLYDDNQQRYTVELDAKDADQAERMAQGCAYLDNNPPDSDENNSPLSVAVDDYMLTIAGVIEIGAEGQPGSIRVAA
jgi:hypothetical protein